MTAVAVASDRARLHLDAVGTTIVTHVARRHSEGMTIRHALPFLRLHSRVRDDAETLSRIRRVAIDMDGDVPQLVVELRRERKDATMPYLTPVPDTFEVPVTAAQDDDPLAEMDIEVTEPETAEPAVEVAGTRDDEPTELMTTAPVHVESPAGAAIVLRRPPLLHVLMAWATRRIEGLLSWLATV